MLHRARVEVSLACLLSAGLLLLCGPARAQRLALPGLSGKAAQPEPPKDPWGAPLLAARSSDFFAPNTRATMIRPCGI